MTEINWQKEVEARKDDFLEDLKGLLRIPSVRDDSKNRRCAVWTGRKTRTRLYDGAW